MTDTSTQTPPEEAPLDLDGSPQAPPAPTGAAQPSDAGASEGAPGTGADAGAKDSSEPEVDNKPEDKRSVEEIAADYIIPISPEAEKVWDKRPEDYLPYAIETAKGLYPTLADRLSSGLTTKVLVDPYVQVARQMLGPATSPDWTDPKWEKALDGGRDAKGNPALMALSDWRTLLQSDPQYGYDKSPQSHQVADNLANTIHAHFTGQPTAPEAPQVPESQQGGEQ